MKTELWMYQKLERLRRNIKRNDISESFYDHCIANIELLEEILGVNEDG